MARQAFGSVLILVLGLTRLAEGQDPRPPVAGVDQAKVDEAITKGIAALKAGDSPSISAGNVNFSNCDELILLTFLHGGVRPNDPEFQELFQRMWEAKMERTYKVALQAMVLEELHRVKYQARIAQCAQFLIDNQCKNGQWSYGTPTPAVSPPEPVPTEFLKKEVASGPKDRAKPAAGPAETKKPKVTRFMQLKKSRDGIAAGDNSNSQVAALGLRACHDAGILIPQEVLQAARDWWVGSAIVSPLPDGAKAGKGAVATGKEERVEPTASWSWCYRGHHLGLQSCKNPDRGYSAMTAGGIGSIILYDTMMKKNWKTDPAVQNGLAWMAENFNVRKHVGTEMHPWLAYNLYAIERLGVFAETETFGSNSWYPEGANFLLESQKPDGSWLLSTEYTKPAYDTCLAILFLRRATRPLRDVASVDRVVPK
jgi:hypothetical protein